MDLKIKCVIETDHFLNATNTLSETEPESSTAEIEIKGDCEAIKKFVAYILSDEVVKACFKE